MGSNQIKLKAIAEGSATIHERDKLAAQRDVLEKSGLVRESKSIQKVINELNFRIKECEQRANSQRLQLIRQMFACFVVSDIITVVSDNTAETFDSVTYGCDKCDGIDFTKIFKEQAKKWNECVQLVDVNLPKNDIGFSMFYSDMAEEAVDEVLPIIYKIIDKYINSKDGKKWI